MENKLNCIIIHGCPSEKNSLIDISERTYYKHWIPWTRETLVAKGVPTVSPIMPEPWAPDYEKFKEEFEKNEINDQTVLVGHSCGCAFLVRWLGETNRKVKKLILVSPWKVSSEPTPIKEKYYNFPINPDIKSNVGEIIMFTSDNEKKGGPENLKIYQDVLGGEVISLPGRGHFMLKDMGTVEFPELIEKIL